MAITFPLEEHRQIATFVVTLVFSTLAVVSVVLRIIGRVKLGRWLDLSDYAMLASTVAMLGVTVAIINAIFHAGLGFHLDDVIGRFGLATGAMDFLQHLMVVRIAGTFSLALSKISILILCCRVFTSKKFHLMANLTNGLIILWTIGNIIIILRICTPIAYNWDKSIEGSCGPATGLFLMSGIINLIADIIVLILPMPYIYKLQLATYKKVTLMVTFGIGFVVCIVSTIKVALLPSVVGTDMTYTTQHTLMLAILEASLAIIVACIPVLRPLFKNSMATRAAKSRYQSRTYSTVPPQKGGSGKGFTELRNLINGDPSAGVSDEEQPLPMRPEKTYYNRIEAVGRSSEDETRDDVELGGMGGITVKTEFTASIEVVEILDRPGRNSVRQSERGSVQKS